MAGRWRFKSLRLASAMPKRHFLGGVIRKPGGTVGGDCRSSDLDRAPRQLGRVMTSDVHVALAPIYGLTEEHPVRE